jgi:hypothetical protein
MLAIGCAFAVSMWALTAHAAAMMLGISAPIYVIFILAAWILIPLYIKLVRQAFILGIFLTAVGFSYLLVTPILYGTAPWYLFKRGLYDFTYVLTYLIGLTGIYFNYKSWKELLARA